MKIYNLILLLLISSISYSQKEDLKFRYLKSKNDQNNGLVVILPGLGSRIDAFEKETDLGNNCLNEGYDVLLIELFGHLILEENELESIDNLIHKTLKNNNLIQKIFIGGFSIGGNFALNYSIYAYKNNKQIIPCKIFILDPPVNLFALYLNSKNYVEKNKCENDFENEICYEDNLIVNLLELYIGKEDKKGVYNKHSYFSDDSENENLKTLINLDLLIFTDCNSRNYNKDQYEKANCHSLIKMHNYLKDKSEKNVILHESTKITSHEDSYMPHSWKIIDFEVLNNFLKK